MRGSILINGCIFLLTRQLSAVLCVATQAPLAWLAKAVKSKQKEDRMKRSMIMLALATLSLLLWAADDAAVLPSQGVAAAPLH
jgi:apolipoprotein N-acyltransferase